MKRTSPLMYHEEAGAFAVMASRGGQPTHPGWFHNLKAFQRHAQGRKIPIVILEPR